ncbi:MAG: hypothetical protein ABI690_18825 [Chloroflexota bacterium]
MYMLNTLYALRARLGLVAAETSDDSRLIAALQAAAYQVERAAGRRFAPRKAALQHTITRPTELLLDDDLLELSTLANGDGTTVPLNNVVLLPDDAPAGGLLLTAGSSFIWTQTPIQAVTVTGIWGWHERWATAWRDSSDTVQNNPLSSSATSITVVDADGLDITGETPRFQVGHLLKIESEYLRVLTVNTATNVLTVLRGVNGTTAASHALNTPIYTYQPAPDIAAIALTHAAHLYREPDAAAAAAAILDSLAPYRRYPVKV